MGAQVPLWFKTLQVLLNRWWRSIPGWLVESPEQGMHIGSELQAVVLFSFFVRRTISAQPRACLPDCKNKPWTRDIWKRCPGEKFSKLSAPAPRHDIPSYQGSRKRLSLTKCPVFYMTTMSSTYSRQSQERKANIEAALAKDPHLRRMN